MPILEAKNLRKEYKSLIAVNGVSFGVEAGEIFGLLGPNGAGKTTLMEMLEGLRTPDGGEAYIDGFNVQKQLGKVKERIGIQLQSTSLFEHLTVEETLKLYGSFYKEHVDLDKLLERLSLTDKAKGKVKELSGGQKQRLSIGIALVHNPMVLFLDEPTTGLDPAARRTLWDLVLSFKEEGRTVLLSTHYMEEAQVLCDRLLIMNQGQIIALDTPQGLINELNAESAIEFSLSKGSGCEDEEQTLRKLSLEELNQKLKHAQSIECHGSEVTILTCDLQAALLELFALTEAKGTKLRDLRTRTATLEDVFLQRTGRRLA